MKKSVILMMLLAGASISSCSKAPKANMKSDVDSLSYLMGVSNTQGLKEYAMGRLGVDSTQWNEFVKGIIAGTKESSPKEKAYLAGMQIGQQISGDMFKAISDQLFEGDSTQTLSKENFLAGFIEAVQQKSKFSVDSAAQLVQLRAEVIKAKALETKYADWKKQNAEYLTKNKAKAGVTTTPSGLQYRVITKGNGAMPADTSRVKVNYEGKLIDGTKFDSSYDRKEPATFVANQVIKGWTEALKMMPVGSKWELVIPAELAYGSRQTGNIKPFSTLIFEVELLSIEK